MARPTNQKISVSEKAKMLGAIDSSILQCIDSGNEDAVFDYLLSALDLLAMTAGYRGEIEKIIHSARTAKDVIRAERRNP